MENNKHPGGSMKQPLGETPTRSQLIPLQTNWRALMTKGYFWPGIVLVISVVVLFSLYTSRATTQITCTCQIPVPRNGTFVWDYVHLLIDLPLYIVVLALLLTAGLAFAAYRIIGKRAPLWVIPVVAGITWLLLDSPVFSIVHMLDFGISNDSESFSLLAIVQGFFAAGLPEEAFKAIPVALGVWAARKIPERGHFLSAFRVVEPLDGILLGFAAGLGFTLNESLLQYVPQQIVYAMHPEWGRVARGAAELMIPRVLQNIAGHAAWSGIVGYYIALAGARPAAAKKLVPLGLGIAALLHGMWDANPGMLLQIAISVVTFMMLAGVIMKGRELSPNHSQLIRSQVLDSAHGAAAAKPSPKPAPSPKPMPSQTVGKSETWGQRSETWEDAPRVEQLEIGGVSIPLVVGTRLTVSQIPALKASAGDGVVALVAANPDDPKMLGLKNLSTETWRVETVGRGTRELGSGRSIRIERGVRIQLGTEQAVIK